MAQIRRQLKSALCGGVNFSSYPFIVKIPSDAQEVSQEIRSPQRVTVFNDIHRSQGPFQTKMTDFGLSSLPLPSEDLSKLLKPIISASQLPLDFYKDRCLRCGRPLVDDGNRYNLHETKKKQICPDCDEVTTLGFNRGMFHSGFGIEFYFQQRKARETLTSKKKC